MTAPRLNAPTLDAYVSADGVYSSVWCGWCVRWHDHGHGPGEPLGAGDGHRWEHCDTFGGPYPAGYYLREVGTWDERPGWRDLPIHCRGCGEPFLRTHPTTRYCGSSCRRANRRTTR